jgi:hypothetical protein
MALAVPVVPSTEGSGVDWPELSYPQQTTFPVPAWIAQLCHPPAAIAVAVPAVPPTEEGTVNWP